MFTNSSEGHPSTRPRRWVALGVILLALGIAGCGSSGSSSSGTTSSSSSTPAAPAEASSSGIPQGEHAGDSDSDNKGGPSDGDGSL